MSHEDRGELVELGLSPTEAQIYLALLHNPSIGASALAGATDLSRSRVYQTLCSLTDKGLVESGAGYGSKFAVVPPAQALPALVRREEESLVERRNVASRLGERLSALAEPIEAAPEELVQVIRNPRAVAERFERLMLEAEQEIETFVKGPILTPHRGNAAQRKAQRRGVHVRALYERSLVEDPAVEPYLEEWVAGGEEARVFDGELPHKLVIFDRKVVLMPLVMLGEQTKTLLIRHPQLAQCLSLAFQHVWDMAEPLVHQGAKRKSAKQNANLSVPSTKRKNKTVRSK